MSKYAQLQTIFFTDVGRAYLHYDPRTDMAKFIRTSTIEKGEVWHYLQSKRKREDAVIQLLKIKEKSLSNRKITNSIDSVISKMEKARKRFTNHLISQAALELRKKTAKNE